MRNEPTATTGLGRRHRRLSDEETRERMLRAAIDMINRTGLTVSLDHIRFEDVIRDADVARSTAYRHWPYRDLFFSDLIKELARTATPGIVADEVALIRKIVTEHEDWLRTAERRHALILELIRQLALLDFRNVLASPGWRTYLALRATFSGLANGELRDQVQAALTQAEADHNALVAKAWKQIAGVLGYRPRPQVAADFSTLATLLSASMHGLVLAALATPDLATQVIVASPPGAAGQEPWSLPALAMANIAMAFLEPDPDTEWNDDRMTMIHDALDDWSGRP
ncbi:TetR/AcrR family transcriptional regulator [Dactylosporangium sp. NPDC051541]|uniref:TetR/AcrR family transcriptional regulator n=1 Tax=Dactylosporangium sp. NPDC051541 TaxID=3363977 RepID=UPI0037874294